MNGVRALGIAEIGDRETPIGPNSRRDENGGEDRFTSVLSRIAGSLRGGTARLDAEEAIASRPASSPPDGRLRRREAGEELPDDDRASGAADALPIAERHVGMLPSRPEAIQEILPAAFEPGIDRPVLMVPSAIIDKPPTPGAVLVDLPASAVPSVAAIGAPDLLSDAPDAAVGELAGPTGPGQPSLFAAVGGPARVETAPPSTVAGEPSGRLTELTPIQQDRAAAEAEFGPRPLPPELPRVTLISRERHFAPAQGSDPVPVMLPADREPDAPAARGSGQAASLETPAAPAKGGQAASLDKPAVPPRGQAVGPDTPAAPANGQAADADTPAVPARGRVAGTDTPAAPAKGETTGAESPPRNGRLAQTGDRLWAPVEPRSRPQNRGGGAPRYVSADIVPASTVTATSSTEGLAPPPGGVADAEQGLALEIAGLPEPSRAAVISQEKSLAPARRIDPARPATAEPLLEPLRSAVAGLAPVDPEATARTVRPVAENPPPSPIVPQSMPRSRERGEHGHPPPGIAPVAASTKTASSESAPTPANAAPGLGQDVLQRISGAVVEAAGGAVLSAAAPAATTNIADNVVTPAPTRALTIRIDLREHGAVHVRLALNGNALSLRMRADREDIAEQLRQDHAKLSDTLSAAGYDTEIIAIESRRNEIAPPSGSDATSPPGSDANGAANADRGAGGENRRPSARQAQAPDQGRGEGSLPHSQEDHEPRNTAQRRAGALYV